MGYRVSASRIAVGVMVGGLVVIAVTGAITAVATTASTADSLPRMVVPGAAELELPKGRYRVYQEQPHQYDDWLGPPEEMPELACGLTDPSGNVIELAPSPEATTYRWKDTEGISALDFRAPESGLYHLTCRKPDGGSAVIVLLRVEPSLDDVIGFGAIGSVVLGRLVGDAVAWRRRRRAAVTQPAEDADGDQAPAAAQAAPTETGPRSEAKRDAERLRSFVASTAAIRATAAEVDPDEHHRRVLAVSGAIMVAVAAVATVTAIVVMGVVGTQGALLLDGAAPGPGAAKPSEPGASDAEPVQLEDLQPGDCLVTGLRTATAAEQVLVVPCSSPHDREVYAVPDLGNDPWPGTAIVQVRTEQFCQVGIGPFLGVAPELSELVWHGYYPEVVSWEGGSTTAACVVGDPAGMVTGTLRGSRR